MGHLSNMAEMTIDQLRFWIECLEQAIEDYEVDIVFERANELYSNGDNEHD